MAEKKTATKKVATAAKAEPKAKKAAATKTTKKVAVKAEETPAAPAKKAPAKKAAAKKVELYINAETAGFRAGDCYQALAAAGKSLTVAEIAKAANISAEEVLLGLGWLFKEGKVVGENIADLRLA